MNNQRFWFLTTILCVACGPQMARSTDPPAPTVPEETIATQAKALGLTVKHDAEDFAKAVKEQAKKVGVAAQQGAKEVQAKVVHQVKITDDNKTDKTDKTDKTAKTEEPAHPK